MEQYQQAIAWWQTQTISTGADLDRVLDSFRVLFAYHSGRIENEEITYHDTRDIFENGRVSSFSGNPRALFEQQNQKLCYEFLKDKIAAREPLDVGLVKEVHRVLTGGTYDGRRFVENGERPGEFKKHDYVAGLHEVGSNAEEVDRDVSALLDELDGFGGQGDTLKAGAYFHARFEYIHPFADGNGRVGRTLLNYFLMIHGHPPLIIYDEDRHVYYDSLQRYDETEELDALHTFLTRQAAKTWEKTLARAK
ncbi:MAG: Fic family protein [Peptococcaceae bacterium]|nr:Fic family protein [Peptococcaceae bacterium]